MARNSRAEVWSVSKNTQPLERLTMDTDDVDKIEDKLKNALVMLDVFKSCIATQTMPAIDSPCHEQIKKLLKKSWNNY